MRLRVRATPNARLNAVIGWEDEPHAGRVLHVRVAAPPVAGQANAALRDFLATTLGLAKSQVVLAKGSTARFKSFDIPDGTPLP